jgi:hypothetical protein
MIQFVAHFDGRNICLDEPISLPENVPLRVTVQDGIISAAALSVPIDLFERLEAKAGLIDGPSDWAAAHDHYLYGAPKRSGDQAE